MRWICLLAILLAVAGAAQNTPDTHGKTEEEILQLGMDRWTDYFTSKEGTSTASMTEAAGIYGEIAQKRNDRLLGAIKNANRRSMLLKLRKLMGTFATSAVDVSYCESGGGTMFNTMWAAVSGVVENTLFPIIARSGPRMKPIGVSTVKKRLAKLHHDVEAMHDDDKDSEFFKYKDARQALAKLDASFAAIVAIAKKLNRADSDRILRFCLQEAVNVDLN